MALEGALVIDTWKKYPDLFDNVDFLLKNGFSRIDVGKLYTRFVLDSYVRYGLPVANASNVKESKHQKRRYQLNTRLFFSDVKIATKLDPNQSRLLVHGLDGEELLAEASRFGSVPGLHTVETYVHNLALLPEPFDRIGMGLTTGARRYMLEEKGGTDTSINPSLFKEYNDILSEMRKLTRTD